LLKILPQKLIEIVKYCHPDPALPISDPMMDQRIADFQKAKEGMHFDARKHSLEDDNVINEQRKIIYACRHGILLSNDLHGILEKYCQESAEQFIQEVQSSAHRQSRQDDLIGFFKKEYEIDTRMIFEKSQDFVIQTNLLANLFFSTYKTRVAHLDQKKIGDFERDLLLRQLDWLWRDHLMQLESVKQQVSLRGYVQKDPKQEYKIEAFGLFERLMAHYTRQIIHIILKAKFLTKQQQEEIDFYQQQNVKEEIVQGNTKRYTFKLKPDQQSRNDLCLCQSGKKYKYCCGALEKKD
jgi:preprotein translocase subunit SecA